MYKYINTISCTQLTEYVHVSTKKYMYMWKYLIGLITFTCPENSTTLPLNSVSYYLVVQLLRIGNKRVVKKSKVGVSLELVSKELNHFGVIAGLFRWFEVKVNFFIIFQKENGNPFTPFIIFMVKSLQKEQNSTNLLL